MRVEPQGIEPGTDIPNKTYVDAERDINGGATGPGDSDLRRQTTIPPQVSMAHVDEMYLVHKMLRREFGLLPDLIRGADRSDTRRRALISAHAQLLCQIPHAHHEGEDMVI